MRAVRLGRAHRDVELFAISWFVCPSASSRSTSRSRSESGSASFAAPRRRRRRRRAARRARGGRSGRRARPRGPRPRPRRRPPPSGRSRSRRRRTPRAHSCGSSCIERTSTFASGSSWISCGSTSIPLRSGITTSSRITSGFSARAWKTASSAFPASPTGSMSVLGLEQQAQARADDRMVVDDEDTDAHRQTAPRRRSSSPRPGATRSRAARRRAPTRSRIPSEPDPSSRLARRVEAPAVVLDTAATTAPRAGRATTLTLRRAARA